MKSRLIEYVYALLAVGATSAVCFPLSGAIGYQTVGLILLMLTAVLSLFLGRGAVIFTAVLNFISWNFFFISPILTFHIANLHDIIVLFANLTVAITGGSLISRLRKSRAEIRQSKERISLLYALLESLSKANSIREVVAKVREELHRHFNADAVVYLKEKEGIVLEMKPFGNAELFDEDEYAKAQAVFAGTQSGHVMKMNQKRLIDYYPLSGKKGYLGVIGIAPDNDIPLDEDKWIYLKSFLTQIASALEREISIDTAKETQVYIESQKLFQVVLNSVSHELRTPISVITSSVSNLLDDRTGADAENRRKICTELDSAVNRLNMLVENILDMSKIESGYIKLNLQTYDVADIIGVVVNHLKKSLPENIIKVDIPDEIPPLKADINWLLQALLNIVYNAINYSPKGTPVLISANEIHDTIAISISDKGPGVPKPLIPRIFEKFYRVPGSQIGGTGLGLTIAKAIAEAHKGTITASNNLDSGLTVTVNLPTNKGDGTNS